MGLGSTTKKLQQVVDAADELYAKLNDLKSELAGMRDSIDETNTRVERLETELAEQRSLLEAVAAEHDIDPAELDAADLETGEDT